MRTSEGKLVLFELATGKQGEFWPIDAKALLACGSHGPDAPVGVVPVVPVMPPKYAGMPVAVVPVGALGRGDAGRSPTDTQTGISPAVDGDSKRSRRKREPSAGQE
jgi:hypothetical protein